MRNYGCTPILQALAPVPDSTGDSGTGSGTSGEFGSGRVLVRTLLLNTCIFRILNFDNLMFLAMEKLRNYAGLSPTVFV